MSVADLYKQCRAHKHFDTGFIDLQMFRGTLEKMYPDRATFVRFVGDTVRSHDHKTPGMQHLHNWAKSHTAALKIHHLKKQLIETNAHLAASRAEVSRLTGRVTELTQTVEAYTRKSQKDQGAIVDLANRIKSLRDELSRAGEGNAALQSQLAQAEADHGSRSEQLRASLAALQQQNSQLTAVIPDLRRNEEEVERLTEVVLDLIARIG